MSQIKTAIWLAVALVLAWLAYQNHQLGQQVQAQASTAGQLSQQLDTAAATIRSQQKSLTLQASQQQATAQDMATLQRRISGLASRYTAAQINLEAITHEQPDATRWGDTPVPAAVQRLFDSTDDAGTAAAPATADPAMRAGDTVPAAATAVPDQPPAGANAAGHPGRAG
ncbi:hypothetical protein QF022_001340 [Vogesella perlucida]|nr:hypothetical protein [Vogesella perlucida]